VLIVHSLWSSNNIIEGLDNNDSLNISKMNTSDIRVLNKQVDELQSIDEQINKIDIETKKNEEDIVKLKMKSEQMKADATKKFEKTKK
jgi:hypothetical protein